MLENRTGQIGFRFLVYFIGLLVMSLGIVFLIKSNLGATPWDVLHVGLFEHFGLTIGSWSVIMGILILTLAAVLSREIPHIGAFLNMLLVGVFIDFYMLLPFMTTPSAIIGKLAMFISGIILMTYGMCIYISANLGTGPRDSLMLALTVKTGWKVRNVRGVIELLVLVIGWRLGGPVNWGTILFSVLIGPLTGLALPQCDRLVSRILNRVKKRKQTSLTVSDEELSRGVER